MKTMNGRMAQVLGLVLGVAIASSISTPAWAYPCDSSGPYGQGPDCQDFTKVANFEDFDAYLQYVLALGDLAQPLPSESEGKAAFKAAGSSLIKKVVKGTLRFLFKDKVDVKASARSATKKVVKETATGRLTSILQVLKSTENQLAGRMSVLLATGKRTVEEEKELEEVIKRLEQTRKEIGITERGVAARAKAAGSVSQALKDAGVDLKELHIQ